MTHIDELEDRLRFMARMTDEPEATLFKRLIILAVQDGSIWPVTGVKLAERMGVTL